CYVTWCSAVASSDLSRWRPSPRHHGGRGARGGGVSPRPAATAGSASGGDLAEEPVGLVVRAGGEVQRLRVAVRAGVAELERPQPVDCDLVAVLVAEGAVLLEVAVRLLRERVDLAVAEVADQEVAAQASPSCRRERDPPRSV